MKVSNNIIMNSRTIRTKQTIFAFVLFLFGTVALTSCGDDDGGDGPQKELESKSFAYHFHNGQTVPGAAYLGGHANNLMADLMVEEMDNGGSKITVTLENTIDGEMYMIHAHDAADAATTPNNTPYNEAPNADLFAQMANGNGSSVTVMQETTMSYSEIMENYAGFFVVHDPLQDVNTADITTYLIVGSFARAQDLTEFSSKEFMYDFNTGQLSADFAYDGAHANTLKAKLTVDQLADGTSRVTTWLMNTMDGEMYGTHAHDAADPMTTPNGTPYNESPNTDVYVNMIAGNGGTASAAQVSTMSYDDLTSTYEGFFVVHDPLQAVNTANPKTYVILGQFAK